MRRIVLLLCVLAGCSGETKVAKTEQRLAKHIGQQGVVEGVLYTIDGAPTVRTTWGLVPLQPMKPITIPDATYVQASGLVDRGKLENGKFTASQPDFRGIRAQHDMVLRRAKVERQAPPASQPTTFPSGLP